MENNNISKLIILCLILLSLYGLIEQPQPKMCLHEIGIVRNIWYKQPTLLKPGQFIINVDGKTLISDDSYNIGDSYYENIRCDLIN